MSKNLLCEGGVRNPVFSQTPVWMGGCNQLLCKLGNSSWGWAEGGQDRRLLHAGGDGPEQHLVVQPKLRIRPQRVGGRQARWQYATNTKS